MTVITDPPGADITIDGQGHWTTPASIDLPMDSALHAVAVELEGYKNEFRRFRLEPGAQELAVTLARVPEAIQPVSDTMLPPHSITPPADPPVDRVIASPGEGGTTSVPPAAPPAPPVPVSAVPLSPPTLVLRAPFPVMLSFEGRVAPASATHTLRLTPGAQTIHVTAPQVFLRRALRFNASDGDVRHEQVPDAVYVQVASVPSNATLKINGWYAGTAPLTPQVVLGPNQFEFAWPGSARTHVVNVEITAAGQRIFGRTPQ